MPDDAKVYFWSLRQKFVDSDDDIPEQAQQVMYYSLAIGHHVGMIDCLKTELVCPLEKYKAWIDLLPEGEAKRKNARITDIWLKSILTQSILTY
ncbi:hydrogenase-4 component J [Proteus penneri]|nr:hydrogenase-4 component J [Proteus penneri]